MTIDGGDFLGRTARSVAGRSQPDCALLVAAGKPDRPVALTLSHLLSCPLCRDAEAVDAAPVAYISVVSIDARALGGLGAAGAPHSLADPTADSGRMPSAVASFMVELRTFCREIRGHVRRGDRTGSSGNMAIYLTPPPPTYSVRA